MFNKKFMVLTILFVTLLTISAVSAEDNVTSDVVGIEEINNEGEITCDLLLNTNDETLKNDVATFSDLKNLIEDSSSGDILELNEDYENDGSISSAILIFNKITIDGKDHILDAKNSSSVFSVLDSDVVLKNIVFKNAYSSNGGALDGEYCNVINCTFVDCSASDGGGAVRYANIYNSSFINCSAGGGGAVDQSSVYGCEFIDCSADYGGAVRFQGNFDVFDSTFTNCYATEKGGAIYDWAGNCGDINNCEFINCTSENYGGAVSQAYVKNSQFRKCTSKKGYALDGSEVVNCTFIDCYAGFYATLDVEVANIAENENALISIVMREKVDQGYLGKAIDADVSVNVDGNDYTVTLVDGNGNLTLSNLVAGSKTVTVTFDGNGLYFPVNETVSFNVLYSTDIIIIVQDKPMENSEIHVQVLLDEMINGSVIIEDDWNEYRVPIINGKGEYELNNLDYGQNTVTVTFKGNDEFSPSSNSTTFRVYRNPDLEIFNFPDEVFAHDDLEFDLWTRVESYSYSNKINVYLSSGNGTRQKTYSWWEDSDIEVIFEDLEAGEYVLTVDYPGYSDYAPSKINKTFNVVLPSPNLYFYVPGTVVAGEILTVDVSVKRDYDGSVRGYVNDVPYEINMADGKGTLEIVPSAIGDYTVTLTASATDNYASQTFNRTFKALSGCNLEVYVNDIVYGQTEYVNISLNENAEGELNVMIDNEKYDIELSHGKLTIPLSNLSKGKHTVIADFTGTGDFISSKKEAIFYVTSNPEIAPLSELIGYLDNDGKIVLQKDYTINSTIDVDYSITVDGNGHAIDADGICRVFNVNANDVHFKNIVFKNAFSPDNGGAVYSSWRDVYYVNCTFLNCSSGSSGGAIYGNYGQIDNCTFVDCKAGYGGAVHLVSSTSKYGVIDNSKFINCQATTSGGAIYARDINNCYILNCTAKYGGGIYAIGHMTNITIENCSATTRGGAVDWHFLAYTGEMNNSTLINCNAPKGSFIYTGGDEMVHYACYNTIFENVLNESKMIQAEQNMPVLSDCVSTLNCRLDVNISVIDEKSAKLNISVLPTAKGITSILVNGNSHDVNLIDGKYESILSDLKSGDLITVKFTGGEGFTSMSKTVLFTAPIKNETDVGNGTSVNGTDVGNGTSVNGTDVGNDTHVNETGDHNDTPVNVTYPVKVTASNLKMLYSDGSAFKITVFGTGGKVASNTPVVIKVAGKKVTTVKTNSKGIATYKPTQAPATYKISATALGKIITKTLTVKHLVSLKSVTVKKSAKKLVLQATLSKVKGKYLKSKKITFKFNGKKYTAKTDKKGVAKVTIKSSVLKKLKVGKKVTYQATYLKDTVKKSVKIKK